MTLKNYEAITLLTALKALVREIGGDADKIFGTNIEDAAQNKAIDKLAELTPNEGDIITYLQSLYQKIVAEFQSTTGKANE